MKDSSTIQRAKEKGISLKQAIKEQAEENGYKLNKKGQFKKDNTMTTQKENNQLGITGTYKGESIGFVPITDDNRLGDAFYSLHSKLPHSKYNDFEDNVHSRLSSGETEGSIHDIEWEVVTESEYDNKQQEQLLEELEYLGYTGLVEDIQDPEIEMNKVDAIRHMKNNFYMLDDEDDESAYQEAHKLVTEYFNLINQ